MYFSVVIPLYNKEKYIKDTLQSVFSQTCQDFEIIIIDDGSTDESIAIAESFKSPKIKIIRQENAGVSVARNHGAKEASGQYIALLDGDDLWGERHLESAKLFFQKYPAVKWYTGRPILAESATALPNFEQQKSFELHDFVSYGSPYTNSSSVVLEKSVFEHCQFPIGIKNLEDRIFFASVASLYPVQGVSHYPTAMYRQTGEGASNSCANTLKSFAFAVEELKKFQNQSQSNSNHCLQELIISYLRQTIFNEPVQKTLQYVWNNHKYLGYVHSLNWLIMLSCFCLFIVMQKVYMSAYHKFATFYHRTKRKSISNKQLKTTMKKKADNPAISVIMPVYNKEKYLLRSINSVLDQTFSNFEMIIVDEGSTDNSAKIIRQFADNRIRSIQQKNMGVSEARNNGMRLAKGQFIAFLDPNDYWYPNHLMLAYQSLTLHDNCWYRGGTAHVQDGNPPPKNLSQKEQIKIMSFYEKNPLPPQSSIVIRSDFVTGLSYDKNLRCFEDIDFLFSLAKLHPNYIYQQRITSCYYQFDGSLTNSSIDIKSLKISFDKCCKSSNDNNVGNYTLREIALLCFRIFFTKQDTKQRINWIWKYKKQLGCFLFLINFGIIVSYLLRGMIDTMIRHLHRENIKILKAYQRNKKSVFL